MTVSTITRKRISGKPNLGTKAAAVRPTTKTSGKSLSQDALYLIVLAGHLKKLLGPASLPHFLATGETRIIHSTINHKTNP